MGTADEWDERYRSKDVPWDTGRHDRGLEAVLTRYDIPIGTVLDLGCGTGSNAIWLARQGATVTATDISPIAIKAARQRAGAEGIAMTFIEGSILDIPLSEVAFDLVFDRGCFHSIPGDDDKTRCIQRLHTALREGGHWLSMIGSADAPPREGGPPMLTAREIVTLVEPLFEIRLIEAGHFDSEQDTPPPAWLCLLRKR